MTDEQLTEIYNRANNVPPKGRPLSTQQIFAAMRAAMATEREACAVLCDAAAMKMEQEAQAAIDSGEHDEVSAIRSTAWKLSVAAADIRRRSNAELCGGPSGPSERAPG